MDYFSKEAIYQRQTDEVVRLWRSEGEQALPERTELAIRKYRELRERAYAASGNKAIENECLREARELLDGFDDIGARMKIILYGTADHTALHLKVIKQEYLRGSFRKMTIWDAEPNRKGINN